MMLGCKVFNHQNGCVCETGTVSTALPPITESDLRRAMLSMYSNGRTVRIPSGQTVNVWTIEGESWYEGDDLKFCASNGTEYREFNKSDTVSWSYDPETGEDQTEQWTSDEDAAFLLCLTPERPESAEKPPVHSPSLAHFKDELDAAEWEDWSHKPGDPPLFEDWSGRGDPSSDWQDWSSLPDADKAAEIERVERAKFPIPPYRQAPKPGFVSYLRRTLTGR
jgi:hypothetical protein